MVLLSARTLLSYHSSSQTALLHRYFVLLRLGLLHSRHLIFFLPHFHHSLLSVAYFSVPLLLLLLLLFAQLRSWFGWLNLLHGNPTRKYAGLHRRMSVSQPNLLRVVPLLAAYVGLLCCHGNQCSQHGSSGKISKSRMANMLYSFILMI